MFNKEGLVLGDLPELDLQDLDKGAIDNEVDLDSLSFEEMNERERIFTALETAKAKVEQAKAAKKDDYTGEKQAKAWCELSELPDPNPYRKEAEVAWFPRRKDSWSVVRLPNNSV